MTRFISFCLHFLTVNTIPNVFVKSKLTENTYVNTQCNTLYRQRAYTNRWLTQTTRFEMLAFIFCGKLSWLCRENNLWMGESRQQIHSCCRSLSHGECVHGQCCISSLKPSFWNCPICKTHDNACCACCINTTSLFTVSAFPNHALIDFNKTTMLKPYLSQDSGVNT